MNPECLLILPKQTTANVEEKRAAQKNNFVLFVLNVSTVRECVAKQQLLPAVIELWQVHTPLSDFSKKLLVQRNAKINKKRNGVVTLPWRLRLQ